MTNPKAESLKEALKELEGVKDAVDINFPGVRTARLRRTAALNAGKLDKNGKPHGGQCFTKEFHKSNAAYKDIIEKTPAYTTALENNPEFKPALAKYRSAYKARFGNATLDKMIFVEDGTADETEKDGVNDLQEAEKGDKEVNAKDDALTDYHITKSIREETIIKLTISAKSPGEALEMSKNHNPDDVVSKNLAHYKTAAWINLPKHTTKENDND